MLQKALVWTLAAVTTAGPLCYGQNDRAARVRAIRNSVAEGKESFDQLPLGLQKALPASARLAHFASVMDRFVAAASNSTVDEPTEGGGFKDDNPFSVRVNDPRRDLAFSPFAGYTQSTTSTARCGEQVVVGFNDSGSILSTLFSGKGGVSFSGVAVSDDDGESFRDLGAVPPGPDPSSFLLGEPSVACSDPDTFYFVQTFTNTDVLGFLSEGLALSKSADGGNTWSDPVHVAGPLSGSDAIDDGRIAVDPSDHRKIYVSYRQLSFGGGASCSALQSTIEVVASVDGGQTFGAPIVIDQQCFATSFLLHVGSRIAVSSKGTVFVASQLYTLFPGLFAQTVQVNSMSSNGVVSPAVTVANIVQGGADITEAAFGFGVGSLTEYTVQGGFRNLRGFDLAVDRSGTKTDGAVYVVWDDGRDKSIPEFESEETGIDGTYEFSDIFFSRSLDGGQTFSAAAKLNSDFQPVNGRGFDHYQPSAAVDHTGTVAVCWYDRRNDPQNFQFERFCAESTNTGNTWAEFRVRGSQSVPSRGQDLLLPRDEMGQYDGVTADFLGHSHGFLDAFQWMSSGMNPDVRMHKF